MYIITFGSNKKYGGNNTEVDRLLNYCFSLCYLPAQVVGDIFAHDLCYVKSDYV